LYTRLFTATEGSEEGTGCIFAPVHSSCNDGFDCTEDLCFPNEDNADAAGCLIIPIDLNCDDNIYCSIDTCSPGIESDINGCIYSFDNNQCNDDGDECTGAIDPYQCTDGTCQSQDLVCPTTVAEVYAGQNYYAGTVTIINDADNFYLIWESDSTWSSNEFEIYIGTEQPPTSSPGSFPHKIEFDENVSFAEFVIPFASNIDCGTFVYVAFHAVVSTSEEVCIESGDCTNSVETAWMSGKDAPEGWHQWGDYNHYEACCCAGFSHLSKILPSNAVEIEFSKKSKSMDSHESHELQEVLSELLDYPASLIEIISIDEIGDLIHAVVKFLNNGNVAGSTIVQLLYTTPPETFVDYGINDFDLQIIESNDYDVYENIVQTTDAIEFSEISSTTSYMTHHSSDRSNFKDTSSDVSDDALLLNPFSYLLIILICLLF